MNGKERRRAIRIPLLKEYCFWNDGPEDRQDEMTDITKYGVFIKSIKMPSLGDILTIKLPLPSGLGLLTVPGKVVWRRWAVSKKNKDKLPLGFAVEFTETDDKRNQIIESYCIYLRNNQIIKVSRRIIEEFFESPIK